MGPTAGRALRASVELAFHEWPGDPPPTLLLHGIGNYGRYWDLFSREVGGRLRLIAPDARGHGDSGKPADGYAAAEFVSDALAVLDALGVDRALVVGHSMGGVVIPKVAELVPARVAHLVFLAAVVLPDGGSLLGTHMPLPSRALMRGLAASGGGVMQYPAAIAHARWMNDLPPGDTRVVAALAQLTPQPARPWLERVDMSRFYAMSVPRTYVRCLRDLAVTPAMAAGYAARLGVRPIDLDTAHGPMLSAPDALVAILEKI